MGARVTHEDVTQAMLSYRRAAEHVFGYKPELQLNVGSKVNGITWKLYELKGDAEGAYTCTPPGVPDIHLGWTASEAYSMLSTIAGVLWSVAARKRETDNA